MKNFLIITAIAGAVLLMSWRTSKRTLDLSKLEHFHEADSKWSGVANPRTILAAMLLQFYGVHMNPQELKAWYQNEGLKEGDLAVLGNLLGKQAKTSNDVKTIMKQEAGIVPLIGVSSIGDVLIVGTIEETGSALFIDTGNKEPLTENSPVDAFSQLIWF